MASLNDTPNLNSLEAGLGSSSTNSETHNQHNYNTYSVSQLDNEGKYIFPAPHTCWNGPDTYSRLSWRVLTILGRIINLPFQKRVTVHMPTVCDNVEEFLAYEAPTYTAMTRLPRTLLEWVC